MNEPLTEQDLTEISNRVPRSVQRQKNAEASRIEAFEKQLFESKSPNECIAIAQDLRDSMTNGTLTGVELVVAGQMLMRAERQRMSLEGNDPDGLAYEDISSSKKSN